VAEAPPQRPSPLSQDELLGLFSGDSVGRDVVLQPATEEDMLGQAVVAKPSLEVIYEQQAA
jgi:chlorophyllide a reductase subunit X